MSPNDLSGIARFLYGERWQSVLARTLDVSDRTVRRWLSGNAIPLGAQAAIIDLVAVHQLSRALPIIEANMHKMKGLPECIELSVYRDDSNVVSPHKRDWSNAVDRRINEKMAEMLCSTGIPAKVIEVG